MIRVEQPFARLMPVALLALACSGGGASDAASPTSPTTMGPGPDMVTSTPANNDRLPCDILDILSRRCNSCHGAEAASGGSVRLVSYTDLLAFSRSDSAVQRGRLALQRFRDTAMPMPPYPAEPLTLAELSSWSQWVNDGLPPRWRGAPDQCPGTAAPVGPCDAPTQVFQLTCASAKCHSTAEHAGGLDLASPAVRERLNGAMSGSPDCGGRVLIDSAQPDRSLLLQKLRGQAGCGMQMPPAPLSLLPAQIDCVRSFISGG